MKKKLILLFCVFTGLAWYMAINESVETPKLLAAHIEQAEAYESKGIYVDAIMEYEAALGYKPGDAEITYKMAKAYRQTGNGKKYISLCKQIIEQNPERTEVLDGLMQYYIEKNDKSAAAKYAAELVEGQPENETVKKWFIELKGSYTESYFLYTELTESYHDTMVVSVEDTETGEILYGVLDANGEELLPVEYKSIQPFSDDGYALAMKDGKTIYVDEDGNTRKVPDMESYDSVSMINNGRLVAGRNGKYGILDDSMEPKAECIYEEAALPADDLSALKQNGKWALADENGKEKTEYLYDDVIRDEYGIASMQKRLFVKEGNAYHMINGKGERVGNLTFETAMPFQNEGYAAVCQSGRWGYVDTEGNLAIVCQFEDARSFSNGYAAICRNGKWGYIDMEGNIIVEPVFDAVTDITSKGRAGVKKEEWAILQLSLFD